PPLDGISGYTKMNPTFTVIRIRPLPSGGRWYFATNDLLEYETRLEGTPNSTPRTSIETNLHVNFLIQNDGGILANTGHAGYGFMIKHTNETRILGGCTTCHASNLEQEKSIFVTMESNVGLHHLLLCL
ncbi:hypothetical protein MUK42_10947, partial [Musa troglodytarum]